MIGFGGLTDQQSLRLCGLPEAAPAVLNGTPLSQQSGQREFAAEVSWDLPNLASGATGLTDVSVSEARVGDLAQASLVSSTRFIELDAAVWSSNTVRVTARNVSAPTVDLAAAPLPVHVRKRPFLPEVKSAQIERGAWRRRTPRPHVEKIQMPDGGQVAAPI